MGTRYQYDVEMESTIWIRNFNKVNEDALEEWERKRKEIER